MSPTGRLLSYIEGRATVVVRNLSSGAAHWISVAGLLGRSEALDEVAPAAWLGDGSEVAVMATPMAVAVAGRALPAQASNHSSASLIVVHVGAGGWPGSANRVQLRGTGDLFRIASDQTRPRSLLAASRAGSIDTNSVACADQTSGYVARAATTERLLLRALAGLKRQPDHRWQPPASRPVIRGSRTALCPRRPASFCCCRPLVRQLVAAVPKQI